MNNTPSPESSSVEPQPKNTDYSQLLKEARAGSAPEEVQASAEGGMDMVLLRDAAELMRSIANNEAKALTLAELALSEKKELTMPELYRSFLAIQGEDGAWLDVGGAIPAGYTQSNFVPQGLADEHIDPSKVRLSKSYSITNYGANRGLSVAGLMMDLSLNYPETGLYDIFGLTKADETGNTSSYARLVLLSHLAEKGSSYENMAELSRQTGLPEPTIRGHVDELTKAHIIETKRRNDVPPDKVIDTVDQHALDTITLRPGAGNVPSTVAAEIRARLTEGSPQISVDEIVDATVAKLQEGYNGATPLQDLAHAYLYKLIDLEVIRIQSEFTREKWAFVRLDASNSELVTDLLVNVQGIMEGDPDYLEWGIQRAQEILTSPDDVNTLLKKTQKSSPARHRLSASEYMHQLSDQLGGGELTAKDIATNLERDGKPATPATVTRILRKMVEAGSVTFEKRSGRNYYRLTSEDV